MKLCNIMKRLLANKIGCHFLETVLHDINNTEMEKVNIKCTVLLCNLPFCYQNRGVVSHHPSSTVECVQVKE